MTYEVKTKETDASVEDYLNQIENDRKREDSFRILKIFKEATGLAPKMWGPSIVGFGSYEYKYASGHSGVATRTGFSPGKGHKISLYILIPDSDKLDSYRERLGKHTAGKACLYINKLADIDEDVLKEMIVAVMKHMNEKYPN